MQNKKTGEWNPFSLTRLTMKQIHGEKFDPNFKLMKEFYADAEAGTLPSYAFLEPQFHGPLQDDQHPPSDIRPGEIFPPRPRSAVSEALLLQFKRQVLPGLERKTDFR